jgi:hypothetical protein
MVKRALLLAAIALTSAAVSIHPVRAQAVVQHDRIGFSTQYPTTYSDWPNGFLAGNGTMGIIVFGNPLDDTVIFDDRAFFIAKTHDRSFAQVSDNDLATIRNLCIAGNYREADDLAAKVPQWKDGGEGAKHPGFKMSITMPDGGPIRDYVRTCNFRTGEITVKWTDDRGAWVRRAFVSRKDNVVVQYLTAPTNGTLNCSVQLGVDSGMHLPQQMAFTSIAVPGSLNLRATYGPDTNQAGYEGVVRVVTDGGSQSVNNGGLTVTGAKSVTMLTRTAKYYSDCVGHWNQKLLQGQLAALPANYQILLKGQIAAHQAIYDRVRMDLHASEADRAKPNEALLAMQKTSAMPVPALWERLFDAGRYYYLSSSSDQYPPDLLGIWTGDTNVGWNGFYTLDANLNLQIGGGNIGDIPEAMEGYFRFIERLRPGFEINARKLLGCRGMLACGNTSGETGLMAAVNTAYPYQYATGEMPWLLYPFWEHYLVTGDKAFLRNRLYPLLKETGLFYEDFLVATDSNGKFIFAGSVSPENSPSNTGVSLTNNSTFDISGARFALTTLITTCNTLGVDQGAGQGVDRWTKLLNKLPPYMINSDGALQEWDWPGLADNYNHRHSSQLLTVWPYREITPETSPALYAAARATLAKKDPFGYGTGHGILHAALIAAGLNNSQSLCTNMLRLTQHDFYYNSLASSHNAGHGIFCTDTCNTVPTILMEMLVSSRPGTLELLPALPQSLPEGTISGVKGRNRVTVEKLSWNMGTRLVRCELKSDIDQKITVIERDGIRSMATNVVVSPSPLGQVARVVHLPAGKPTSIEIVVNRNDTM